MSGRSGAKSAGSYHHTSICSCCWTVQGKACCITWPCGIPPYSRKFALDAATRHAFPPSSRLGCIQCADLGVRSATSLQTPPNTDVDILSQVALTSFDVCAARRALFTMVCCVCCCIASQAFAVSASSTSAAAAAVLGRSDSSDDLSFDLDWRPNLRCDREGGSVTDSRSLRH